MEQFDLQKSPIRRNIKSLREGQLSVFEEGTFEGDGNDKRFVGLQVRTILSDVENMLGVMKSHENEALRVAVMGEVKAGKSTFINALMRKKVAYTDILEATAIVSEIVYSDEEYARLINKDGTVEKEFTFGEMLEWMEEMVDEEADFSNYERIEIGLNSEILEDMIVVDTPGLLSITSQNHDVTNRYIAETDYILWVINSHNLGSKAVNDYIDKIRLTGKPIIGIINKVDSEAERNEIEDYIEKEYSSIFEEIFYVSAQNAWNEIESSNDESEGDFGLLDVLDCLEDLGDDKEHSTSQTSYYQLQRDKEVHIRMRERIKERKGYYDNEMSAFSYVNNELKKSIHKELRRWYKDELFVDEKQKLLGSSMEDFTTLFNQFKDPVYITDIISRKYDEVTQFIYRKWDIVIEALALTSSEVIVDFTYDKDIALNESTTNEKIRDRLSKKVKEGMAKGAAIGVTFAGYWAWLGPAAATATFAGSLIPITIPFAVGGAAIAAIGNKISADAENLENEEKKQKAVDDLYKEVMSFMAKECEQMEKGLIACTDRYYEDKCEDYRNKTAQFNFDFTNPAYHDFEEELDSYISELEKGIAVLEKNEIPEPPKMGDAERENQI